MIGASSPNLKVLPTGLFDDENRLLATDHKAKIQTNVEIVLSELAKGLQL